MRDELPEGWAQCRVKDLFKSFSGGTPSKCKTAYWGGTIPWLSSGDIKADKVSTGTDFITKAGLENSSSKICRPGSVLVVVRSGILKHTLPVSLLVLKAAINQDIKCFDSGRDDLNSWLALALRAFSKQILTLNREGTTVQSVKYETLKDFQLRIPPLAEQKLITEKLEKLLTEVEQCKGRMAKIPVLLKRFRQSVLAAACSGRLTADWRIKHVASEPGETSTESDDLPQGWRAVCVGDVIDDLKYGTSQKCGYEKRGVPVLRIPNVAKGIIDHGDIKYAVLPAKEQKQLHLLPGDILIVRSNGSVSLVGKCALAGEKERGFSYAGYLIRIRPNQSIISSEFLNLLLSSYDVRLQIELEARSTSGVNNINSEEVRALRLSLPPLDEQEEIVRRVKSLFALADKIESRYQGVQQQMNRIPQSILAKAFRGELVPTEAELAEREGRTYESAEQLLQRIRAASTEPTAVRGNGHSRAKRGTR